MNKLVQVLMCPCNPGKVYASRITFAAHEKSKRHREFMANRSIKEYRIRIQQLEDENGRLKEEIDRLQYFIDHPRRRKVSEKTKKIVAAGQAWRCKLCNDILQSTYQVDHVVPLYRGGSNAPDNLRALCVGCHAEKTQNESTA